MVENEYNSSLKALLTSTQTKNTLSLPHQEKKMPAKIVYLHTPLGSDDKAAIDSVQANKLVDSKYETKVIDTKMSTRVKFSVGSVSDAIEFINARTSDRGYSPYVGVSERTELIRKNLVFMQEAYLKEALAFALRTTETTKEEWTMVRPFEENDKTVYINHTGEDYNVIDCTSGKALRVTNDSNYTGAGAITVQPRISMNPKDCTITFKLVVKSVALYQGREVNNFSDELYDVELPEGMSMPPPIAMEPGRKRMRA